jgi:hypothetical protein
MRTNQEVPGIQCYQDNICGRCWNGLKLCSMPQSVVECICLATGCRNVSACAVPEHELLLQTRELNSGISCRLLRFIEINLFKNSAVYNSHDLFKRIKNHWKTNVSDTGLASFIRYTEGEYLICGVLQKCLVSITRSNDGD